jgi:hypothetical protein
MYTSPDCRLTYNTMQHTALILPVVQQSKHIHPTLTLEAVSPRITPGPKSMSGADTDRSAFFVRHLIGMLKGPVSAIIDTWVSMSS